MKINSIIPFMGLLVLSAMVSCSLKDDLTGPMGDGHSFSIEAELPEIEQESETKGYLGSFISAKWKADDSVSVVNLTKGSILRGVLVSGSEGTRTTFSGTVYGTIEQGDRIALFYPAFCNAAEQEFGDRQFSLATQSRDANVPLLAYSSFTADTEGGGFSGLNLSFYYIASFFKLNMAGLPAADTVSSVTVRNIPASLTVSVNDGGDGFNVATDAEKAAMGKIVIDGPFCTSTAGALTVSLGVMPSDSCAARAVMVSFKSGGDYLSPLTPAKLASHKYYNAIASGFEKVSYSGAWNYGVYDVSRQAALDEYSDFGSTVITGVESGEHDFSLVNSAAGSYWTLKGISPDVKEGDVLDARVYSYGIADLHEGVRYGAKVTMIEPDGDCSRIWINASDHLFIVRK